MCETSKALHTPALKALYRSVTITARNEYALEEVNVDALLRTCSYQDNYIRFIRSIQVNSVFHDTTYERCDHDLYEDSETEDTETEGTEAKGIETESTGADIETENNENGSIEKESIDTEGTETEDFELNVIEKLGEKLLPLFEQFDQRQLRSFG